jgi:SAM-dependent methyltransferase
MAIGSIHTEWLFRVWEKGGFAQRHRLFDLGPQDVQASRSSLAASIERHLGVDPAPLLDRFCDGDSPRRDCQLAYYSLFGIDHYRSADLDDDRADYKIDLNREAPDVGRGTFDVVTNFGTAEHIFNISQVFTTMHELLAPGGLALHVVPAFAFPNHGFYTPNPNLFVEFARANQYALLDFSYVDNMFVRDRLLGADPASPLDFDALPIRIEDMVDTQRFMTKVVMRFHENLLAPETQRALTILSPHLEGKPYPSAEHHVCFVFDLIFVAMTKPSFERPLVPPIQQMSGVPPLEASASAASRAAVES